MLATASALAMLVRLRLDQMALQPGQGHFPFRHCQPQRLRRVFDRRGAAGADLVHLHGSLRSAQFDHHPPLHAILPVQRQREILSLLAGWPVGALRHEERAVVDRWSQHPFR
jgi:hypothetical protein